VDAVTRLLPPAQAVPLVFDRLYPQNPEAFDVVGWHKDEAAFRQRVISQTFSSAILLVEDNMYYASMRAPYHRAAIKAKCWIAMITVDCDVDTCLARNEARGPQLRVPPEVIPRMYQRLEGPVGWERSVSMTISGTGDIATNAAAVLQFITHIIKETPLPQGVPSSSSAVPAQGGGVLHSCDLQLRKWVGEHIQNAEDGIDRAMLATQLQLKRAVAMRYAAQYFPRTCGDSTAMEGFITELQGKWDSML
jgi:tRNA uridine 5-carbamoylmethylation protein Kti12